MGRGYFRGPDLKDNTGTRLTDTTGKAVEHPLVLLGMGNVHRELLGILERKTDSLVGRYGVTFPVAACADRSGFIRGPDGGGRISAAAMLAAKVNGGKLREIPGAEPVSLEEALDLAGSRGILLDAASMAVETGGIGLRAARAALNRGVSVVFANKSAVALAFDEIEALARERGAGLGWSATGLRRASGGERRAARPGGGRVPAAPGRVQQHQQPGPGPDGRGAEPRRGGPRRPSGAGSPRRTPRTT